MSLVGMIGPVILVSYGVQCRQVRLTYSSKSVGFGRGRPVCERILEVFVTVTVAGQDNHTTDGGALSISGGEKIRERR